MMNTMMKRTRLRFWSPALTMLTLLSLACPATQDDAPQREAEAKATPADPGEVVVFSQAPGWRGGRTCTEVRPEDNCDSQWEHKKSGQLVRVFVIEVKDERALDAFVDKLAADVSQKGGVVDRFTQNNLTLVRFLQPIGGDEGPPTLAAINYALVGRDKQAVHLMTSVVGFDEQQDTDARMRELLTFAAWQPRRPPPQDGGQRPR